MVHFARDMMIDPVQDVTLAGSRLAPVHHSVLVVGDEDSDNEILNSICEFLGMGVEQVTSEDDLARMLPGLCPMAIIANVEGAKQDGFHVMKVAANYDRSLPVLLLTKNDPALLGAVDAVREMVGLSRVTTAGSVAEVGVLVDFICQSARQAGKSRLMRV